MLSETIQKKMDLLQERFPTRQALLLPLLHAVQEEVGWISLQSMRDIAQYLELPLSKVREVVTFYTMYQQEPVGKVHLQLCTNISCWLNGSEKVLHCLEKKLGIKCGETTADGQFTLSEVECLASCGTGPVIQVNKDYCESMDEQKVDSLLANLENQ